MSGSVKGDHDPKQQVSSIAKTPEEPTLFGGYDPATHALRLTVEAASVEEARRRMVAVAPLVEITEIERFTVLVMERPSREVPLFMQGFFEATRLGILRPSRAVAQSVAQ